MFYSLRVLGLRAKAKKGKLSVPQKIGWNVSLKVNCYQFPLFLTPYLLKQKLKATSYFCVKFMTTLVNFSGQYTSSKQCKKSAKQEASNIIIIALPAFPALIA